MRWYAGDVTSVTPFASLQGKRGAFTRACRTSRGWWGRGWGCTAITCCWERTIKPDFDIIGTLVEDRVVRLSALEAPPTPTSRPRLRGSESHADLHADVHADEDLHANAGRRPTRRRRRSRRRTPDGRRGGDVDGADNTDGGVDADAHKHAPRRRRPIRRRIRPRPRHAHADLHADAHGCARGAGYRGGAGVCESWPILAGGGIALAGGNSRNVGTLPQESLLKRWG